MTVVGAGGVRITELVETARFHKEYGNLDPALKDRVDVALRKLPENPMPQGIRFEKLKGYRRPDIYTIHATGNIKISMEITGEGVAFLRRVAPHDDIDRCP